MDTLLPFLVSGLGVGAVYALSGVGLVVLFRSSGVLNFAFGAIGALGAHCAWSVMQADGSQGLAWAVAIGVAMAVSLAYGRLLAPALAERDISIRSIGTLGLALMLMGFAEWYWGEGPRRLVLPTDADGIEFGDVRLVWTRALGFSRCRFRRLVPSSAGLDRHQLCNYDDRRRHDRQRQLHPA